MKGTRDLEEKKNQEEEEGGGGGRKKLPAVGVIRSATVATRHPTESRI